MGERGNTFVDLLCKFFCKIAILQSQISTLIPVFSEGVNGLGVNGVGVHGVGGHDHGLLTLQRFKDVVLFVSGQRKTNQHNFQTAKV
jgi:hypothetical protein